jgi:uncharacterized protein YbjT (DUF2867 family)
VAASVIQAVFRTGENGKTYSLTGPHLLDGPLITRLLSHVLNRPLHFVSSNTASASRYLSTVLPPSSSQLVQFMIELFTLVRDNQLKLFTRDVEYLTGDEAMGIDEYLEKNSESFK